MAFGDGTNVILGPKSALVFNQMARERFADQTRKASALFMMATGERVPGVDDSFSRSENISGDQVEIPTLGKLRSVSGVTDGASELAAVTPVDIDGEANLKADIGHYAHTIPVRDSLIDKVSSKQLKHEAFFEHVYKLAWSSFRDRFLSDLNATGTAGYAATDRVGSPWSLISDGTSTGETTLTSFYGLDRTAVGNELYKSPVSYLNGNLTALKVRQAQLASYNNDGNPSVGVVGATVYGILQSLFEQYTRSTITADGMVEFSGQWLNYAGTMFCLENKAPTGQMLLLDPSTWFARTRDVDLTKTGVIPWPGLASAHALIMHKYLGLFCDTPNKNVKVTAITG